MDLSGPHEGTPQPGVRVGVSLAHYLLVVAVKFAEERRLDHTSVDDINVHAREHEHEDEQLQPQSPQDEEPQQVQELWKKGLIYAALLERKSETPKRLQGLLAQIRAEHGSMPEKLVYRVHSDCGSEFTPTWRSTYISMAPCTPQHRDTIPVRTEPQKMQWDS